ncbi:MAG: LysR family transcriptional regulator [Thiohalocapsa sp.]|nr:LysR family transcriptional regulator [Thiohalocapsa sp.]
MDTELLKTFLEVNRTRHFGKAADNLFLTQSAVSARIRQLEQILGVALFTRTRNNVQLTPQGERLLRHADNILNTWSRARQEIAAPDAAMAALAVGAVPSLWDIYLAQWLVDIAGRVPALSVIAEAHGADALLRRVRERTLDLAFSFESPQVAEIAVVELIGVRLVMVTTHGDLGAEALFDRGDYVLVDWGTGFAGAHAQAFHGAPPPRLRVGHWRLAHALIGARGGSAYLPEPIVAPDLESGRLTRVAEAPAIERATFAFHHPDAGPEGRVETLLAPLRAGNTAAA